MSHWYATGVLIGLGLIVIGIAILWLMLGRRP